MNAPGAFPTLRSGVRLTDDKQPSAAIYDVKFYPYTEPGEDAVFAAVVGREIYVCRPVADQKHPLEVLKVFHDPHDDSSLNSVVWSQDLVTGDPLLCIAGAGSAKIRVLNVITGDFLRAVGGHGAAINDLAISPLSPAILASASADHTIRIWNLDQDYAKQPCAAILAGAGHKQDILAIGFHKLGRYLMSGGSDTQVNMWTMPEVPDDNAGTDKTTIVYYPLFSSTEVHSGYVDCVRFHGDLIISHSNIRNEHAKLNTIILWKIDGFSSADPVPTEPQIPTPGVFTRSAFGGRFQRLLTFEMPWTTPFYMRFSLFDQPGFHPMLVMGNERSKVSFWDLQRLEDRTDVVDENAPKGKKRVKAAVPAGRGGRASGGVGVGVGVGMGNKFLSPMNSEDFTSTIAGSERSASTDGTISTITDPKYHIDDPFQPIPPHHAVTVKRYDFTTRQVAWSTCGKWCVVAGDYAVLCLLKRWDDDDVKITTDEKVDERVEDRMDDRADEKRDE